MSTTLEREFYRRTAFYRYHPDFDVNEREYKIRLANKLRLAREQIQSNSGDPLQSIRTALRSGDNNIVTWRLQVSLFHWFDVQPEKAISHLAELWKEETSLPNRLADFVDALRRADIQQPGAQLVISSTLLMALSAQQFPPVRMDAFKAAMDLAGKPTLYSTNDPIERYLLARDFIEWMIETSEQYRIQLRDPLDAQGVIWCLSDRWPKFPIPDSWFDDPDKREQEIAVEYGSELEALSNEHGGKDLTPTEKEALVKARRGQGKFRESVLAYWGNCAVSSCCELKLLRASHIKPWKHSTNFERLDGNNGLLLNPTLDAAFDRGFISFADDGKALISPLLTVGDRDALGIKPGLRLRRVNSACLPYLEYHRQHVFKKKAVKAKKSKT